MVNASAVTCTINEIFQMHEELNIYTTVYSTILINKDSRAAMYVHQSSLLVEDAGKYNTNILCNSKTVRCITCSVSAKFAT